MNVTIVKEDKMVLIDGEAMDFDFVLPTNVWAVQWNGTSGEVEFNDGTANEVITDFTAYQNLVDGHATEKQRLADVAVQEEADRIANMTYAEKRAGEYPSTADQLDDIYHNGIDGWKVVIKSIKDQYPKTGE